MLDGDGDGDTYLDDFFSLSLLVSSEDEWNITTFNNYDGRSYWCGDEELNGLQSLNHFNKKHRMFIRQFSNGATEIQLDNSSRMLVPKKLCEYAEIKNEAVFYAYGNRIEIWSKHLYEDMMDVDADDFANLAEDVMGNATTGGDNE